MIQDLHYKTKVDLLEKHMNQDKLFVNNNLLKEMRRNIFPVKFEENFDNEVPVEIAVQRYYIYFLGVQRVLRDYKIVLESYFEDPFLLNYDDIVQADATVKKMLDLLCN